MAARRRVTVVLVAVAMAVVAAVCISAFEPEKADAVPSTTVRTCDGGSIMLNENEWVVLRLQNHVRRIYGLERLCVDPTLTAAARGHSADMIQRNYFGHGLVGARLASFGYNWSTYGENIAGGYGRRLSSPRHMFDMWWASPAHHANIMNGAFEEVGIGTATGEYNGIARYTMYTVDFGTPSF
jgi:uncharacterized protein YkwD